MLPSDTYSFKCRDILCNWKSSVGYEYRGESDIFTKVRLLHISTHFFKDFSYLYNRYNLKDNQIVLASNDYNQL